MKATMATMADDVNHKKQSLEIVRQDTSFLPRETRNYVHLFGLFVFAVVDVCCYQCCCSRLVAPLHFVRMLKGTKLILLLTKHNIT